MNAILEQTIKAELGSRKDAKPDDPLFVNQFGTRYKKIRKALKAACEKAKVPHCTHHSLRHAFATMIKDEMVKKTGGYNLGAISKALGHANERITAQIYVHWLSPEVTAAVDMVEICKKSAK